jgi:hypothetical protein
MEVSNVLISKSLEFFHLTVIGNCFLEGDFITLVHFHDENMKYIDDQKDVDVIVLNDVVLHEVTHDR